MSDDNTIPAGKRWSLRELFLVVTAFGCAMGWWLEYSRNIDPESWTTSQAIDAMKQEGKREMYLSSQFGGEEHGQYYLEFRPSSK